MKFYDREHGCVPDSFMSALLIVLSIVMVMSVLLLFD